jgi:hypothetical protein
MLIQDPLLRRLGVQAPRAGSLQFSAPLLLIVLTVNHRDSPLVRVRGGHACLALALTLKCQQARRSSGGTSWAEVADLIPGVSIRSAQVHAECAAGCLNANLDLNALAFILEPEVPAGGIGLCQPGCAPRQPLARHELIHPRTR